MRSENEVRKKYIDLKCSMWGTIDYDKEIEMLKWVLAGDKEAVLGAVPDTICPFCGENGFDLPGLKSHIEHGDCNKYNNTESIHRLF